MFAALRHRKMAGAFALALMLALAVQLVAAGADTCSRESQAIHRYLESKHAARIPARGFGLRG